MSDELVVVLIVAIRLTLPLLIPIFPLPTILSLLVLDAADQSILQKHTDLSLDDYQGYEGTAPSRRSEPGSRRRRPLQGLVTPR
ncbi:MAG TPA: hypothetical protein VIT24_10650 [Acidimicrobiales bacterium]